jgi:hypothetical protein
MISARSWRAPRSRKHMPQTGRAVKLTFIDAPVRIPLWDNYDLPARNSHPTPLRRAGAIARLLARNPAAVSRSH